MNAPERMAFDEIRGAESGVRAVMHARLRAANASSRGAAKCGCLPARACATCRVFHAVWIARHCSLCPAETNKVPDGISLTWTFMRTVDAQTTKKQAAREGGLQEWKSYFVVKRVA
jgi:hypothetical protein